MRFSVDAHAIGCHLTGNEVYIRNLLNAFAATDDEAEFIAYLSVPEAAELVPHCFSQRRVSRNPFVRLGFDLPRRVRRDKPDLLHVQYTAPITPKESQGTPSFDAKPGMMVWKGRLPGA